MRTLEEANFIPALENSARFTVAYINDHQLSQESV